MLVTRRASAYWKIFVGLNIQIVFYISKFLLNFLFLMRTILSKVVDRDNYFEAESTVSHSVTWLTVCRAPQVFQTFFQTSSHLIVDVCHSESCWIWKIICEDLGMKKTNKIEHYNFLQTIFRGSLYLIADVCHSESFWLWSIRNIC